MTFDCAFCDDEINKMKMSRSMKKCLLTQFSLFTTLTYVRCINGAVCHATCPMSKVFVASWQRQGCGGLVRVEDAPTRRPKISLESY